MSKAVMISIRPKWCELIASGEKTIEVRKTAPKIDTSFKCYIYQTKKKWIYRLLEKLGLWQGKVIGEFVCDRIYEAIPDYDPFLKKFFNYDFWDDNGNLIEDCLTDEQKDNYAHGATLYGWHISNLVIYDKPKELGEFYTVCHKLDSDQCGNCPHLRIEPCTYPCDDDIDTWCGVYNCNPLTRPPQSWCYVEEV